MERIKTNNNNIPSPDCMENYIYPNDCEIEYLKDRIEQIENLREEI